MPRRIPLNGAAQRADRPEEEIAMRNATIGVLVGLLLIGIGFSSFAAKPAVRAHGEFWTELHIANQWLDLQFAFNVRDQGEDDHGNLSMRIFDHWTGKLIAVGLSFGEMDVFVVSGWVLFTTAMRTSYFDEDYYLPLPSVILFQAFDGGEDDQFKLFTAPLPVNKGKIVVR